MAAYIKDIVSGLFLVLIAGIGFWEASNIKPRFPMGVDSGFFPQIAFGMLGLFAFFIAARALYSKTGTQDDVPILPAGKKAAALTILAIVAYCLVIPVAGFAIATFFFLTAQMLILAPKGSMKPLWFMGISGVITMIVYAAFTYGFNLVLPTGTVW